MFSKITVNLMVANVDETIDFYERVLGFRLVLGVPEGSQQILTARTGGTPLGFAIIGRDDAQLMLQSRTSLSAELPAFAGQKPGGAITIYMQVADVRKLYDDVRGKVDVLKDLHATFYGTEEFYVCDCNGYVLTLAGQQEPAA